MGEWTVRERTVLEMAEPISSVEVRVVSGHVDVVPGDSEGAHLEVTEIDGPPLRVTVDNGRLTIAHEDLHWSSCSASGCGSRERRRAVVSVAVPAQLQRLGRCRRRGCDRRGSRRRRHRALRQR